MADYYPLISRAVAKLPQNTNAARSALYNRARSALVTQLHGRSKSEVTSHRQLLEEAILKVETEAFGNQKQLGQKYSEQKQPGPHIPVPPTAPGKLSDRLGKLLAHSIMRHTGGEPVQLAGLVFWSVIQTEAKQGGLAGFAQNPARGLELGLHFGAAGVLAAGYMNKGEPAQITCDLGIVAIGNRRVFLLTLGRVPMVGASASGATLPRELLDHFPLEFVATKVDAIRPLSATAEGDSLRIRALGRARPDLVVRAPKWGMEGLAVGADAIATAVRNLIEFPTPEDVIAAALPMDQSPLDPRAEMAFADGDYADSFVDAYTQQGRDVRRALVLAARVAPLPLKEMIGKCLRSPGAGMSIGFSGKMSIGGKIFVIILYAGCAGLVGLLTVDLGGTLISGSQRIHGQIVLLTDSDKIGMIASVSIADSIVLSLGLALLVAWWRRNRDRRIERRLFAQGGGLGGWLDAFPALIAMKKGLPPLRSWAEIESSMRSIPVFAHRVSASLLGLKPKDREAFLTVAPLELRNFLIQSMLSHKRLFRSVVPKCCLAVWLLCLALGPYGVANGIAAVPLSPSDWMLFLSGMGAIPAIVLFVLQIKHGLTQRLLRRMF